MGCEDNYSGFYLSIWVDFVLCCSSYVAAEQARMRQLQVDNEETTLLDIPVNDDLAAKGKCYCLFQ